MNRLVAIALVHLALLLAVLLALATEQAFAEAVSYTHLTLPTN